MTSRILLPGTAALLLALMGCAGQSDPGAGGGAGGGAVGGEAPSSRKQSAAKTGAPPAGARPRPSATAAKPAPAPAATPGATRDRPVRQRPPVTADSRPGGRAELAELPDHDRAQEERAWRRLARKRRLEARRNWRAVQRENDRQSSKFRASLTSTQLSALRGFRQRLARQERGYLSRFHRRLAAFSAGRGGDRLVVLQIGDSHTASDNFSGYLRRRLQERYGDAGRGMLAAGVPYRFFRPFEMKVTQTDGWVVHSSRRKDAQGPFGITGYTLEGESDEDVITLAMRGTQTFRRLEVEYMTSRRGGSFTVQIDKRIVRTISTRGRGGPARAVIQAPPGAWFVAIRPKGDGKVKLLSWSTYKGRRGVVYMNQGISGETIDILERWDPEIARWQLAHLRPALIIVAFGTNEGFDHKLKIDEYAERFAARLQDLRRLAPDADIVVVGAPDAARLPSWCARSRSWRRRRALREKADCGRLKASHAENYARLIDKKSKQLCYWHAPPTLAKVRRVQFRAARQLGLYYWAWSRVMGGTCGTDRWARKDEPLAYRDRVHMTVAGYDVSAEAFYEALMRDYKGR